MTVNARVFLVLLLAASAGRAMSPPEAALRQADADWAEAAATANVDAWMAYYAAEAVVLAPDEPIATDPGHIREVVSKLLALPHLKISWQPTRIEVATDGDMAYLIGAYELSYDGAQAVRTTDRGKLLEVWRKQANGRWKCIVDTWNSDGPGSVAAPPHAADPGQDGEYGAMPVNYEATVHRYFQDNLSYPESMRYERITPPEKSAIKALGSGLLIRQSTLKGWSVDATVDARNSHGTYVGLKTYRFLFRGEKIVHTVSPLGGDEMK